MPHLTLGAKNFQKCVITASQQQLTGPGWMGPTEQLVGRQSLSERKASSRLRTLRWVSNCGTTRNPWTLSLVVRSTCASVTRRAATNSARANEGLLLSLCCVLKKKLEKRGGNIYSSDNEWLSEGSPSEYFFLHWQSDREEWQVREWLGSWVSQDQGPCSNSCR